MSELKSEMAFEVGDIVYFKTASHDCDHKPKKFIVSERFVQQCHGGIQRFYRLQNGTDQGNLIPEVALSHVMPKYEFISEKRITDEITKETTIRTASNIAWQDAVKSLKKEEDSAEE